MSTPFQEYGELGKDQIAALVEAEIITNPELAEKYEELLGRCLLRPTLVGCQRQSDPSAGGPTPLWLILEEPAAQHDPYFLVYDPNDPYVPGIITFDHAARRFVATRLFDTEVGRIRAFRMYYGPLL